MWHRAHTTPRRLSFLLKAPRRNLSCRHTNSSSRTASPTLTMVLMLLMCRLPLLLHPPVLAGHPTKVRSRHMPAWAVPHRRRSDPLWRTAQAPLAMVTRDHISTMLILHQAVALLAELLLLPLPLRLLRLQLVIVRTVPQPHPQSACVNGKTTIT